MQQLLQERIENASLRPGDQLPTENELAQELAVNRLTVWQAIAELSLAGQLEVRRAVGTFVAPPPTQFVVTLGAQRSKAAVEETTQALRGDGRIAQETLISSAIAEDAQVREHLGLPRHRLRRVDTLFGVDGQPWAVNTYWFADSRFRGITAHLADDGSVFRVCSDVCGVDLRDAWRSFAAAAARPRDAELLDIPVGTPVLERDGLNVDADGRPTTFVTRRLRSDRVRFVLNYDLDD